MSKLRKKIKFLFLALCPILMGCSADDSLVLLPNNTEEELMEIRLCAVTTPLADVEVTRATKTTFEEGDEIGVCVLPNYYDNYSFVLDNSHFVSDKLCYFPLNKDEVTITAYYPYSETITDNKLPIKNDVAYKDGEWSNATTDPLWATKTIEHPERDSDNTATITVSMEFKHQLAHLQLNIDNDVITQKIEITFKEQQYGYMDITTGEITSAYPDANHTISMPMASIEDGTNTSGPASINGRFLPNEDAIVSITIYQNGEPKTIFPNNQTDKISLESGKITSIRITRGQRASTRTDNEICLSIEE